MTRTRLALALLLVPAPALAQHAATSRPAHHAPSDTGPVVLAQHPGSSLDAAARQLSAQDLAGPQGGSGAPLVLTASAPLAGPGRPEALFVQLQSAALCGSAGCSTSVYVYDHGAWRQVLDSVSGPVSVSPEIHRGMHDLIVNRTDRWEWTGRSYRDTMGAPPLNLRKSIERQRPGTVERIGRQQG